MNRLAKKIRDMRMILKLDQGEFGKLVGNYGKSHSDDNAVPQSTVSKWERGVQKPTVEYMNQLAGVAGVSVEEFLGLHITNSPPAAQGRTVRVIGPLAAGDWREASQWSEDEQYEVPAPLPRKMRDMALIGYEVEGPSMNKVYPDGSVVFVAPISTLGRMPVTGERVAVQRVDAAGNYEASLKEFVQDDDGKVWLWPRSTHPEHQAPIQYVDKRRRIDEVTILGIVMAALVIETPRA